MRTTTTRRQLQRRPAKWALKRTWADKQAGEEQEEQGEEGNEGEGGERERERGSRGGARGQGAGALAYQAEDRRAHSPTHSDRLRLGWRNRRRRRTFLGAQKSPEESWFHRLGMGRERRERKEGRGDERAKKSGAKRSLS